MFFSHSLDFLGINLMEKSCVLTTHPSMIFVTSGHLSAASFLIEAALVRLTDLFLHGGRKMACAASGAAC